MNLKEDVLTRDNALHTLGAVTFTAGFGWAGPPFIIAALVMVALYVREAWQAEWDFTLRWSFHKWAEALIASAAAFVAAGAVTLIHRVLA